MNTKFKNNNNNHTAKSKPECSSVDPSPGCMSSTPGVDGGEGQVSMLLVAGPAVASAAIFLSVKPRVLSLVAIMVSGHPGVYPGGSTAQSPHGSKADVTWQSAAKSGGDNRNCSTQP